MSPYVSHPLIAAALAAVLACAVCFGLAHLGIHEIPVPVVACLVAAVGVSMLYYGREAGQREHDLKNLGVNRYLAAAGSLFMFRWSLANLAQWAVAAAGSLLAAAALALYWWKFI